jgi:voltage-gated potassium channel
MNFKNRIWELMEYHEEDHGLSKFFDFFLMAMIIISLISIILETEIYVKDNYYNVLYLIDTTIVIIFTIEYLLRLFTCTSSKIFSGKYGRIRYVFSPMGLIDLIAILPFYITFMTNNLLFLRILRILRILRLFKSFQYSKSLDKILNIFEKRKDDILASLMILICLLTITSVGIYYAENEAQPEKFSSILSSMWWSVATLTTVGYGDIYPITTLGKFFGSLSAIFGVGLFAIPTAILASGFAEHESTEIVKCKICGHINEKE